jgi:hypothetical protein
MNPLIRKETRLLLPAWMAALVAATLPVWPWLNTNDGAWWLIFGLAILALPLSPFGQEMSYGTFGLLLVQPEERRRFWRIKTGLLAVALVSAWALFALCLWNSPAWLGHNDCARWLEVSALMTLLAFSGGLWSTLLLRDIGISFFCACIIPALIGAATLLSVGHWIDPESNRFFSILCCVLAAYAAAGFWWARRLFLGAQEVAWSGGQISLTSVRGVSLRWLAFEFKGRQNRWTALVKKELQLQEAAMVLIPLLALLHLAALAIHYFAPQRIPGDVVFNAIPFICMIVVPSVVGCVAVAEERRLNTLDSLLCLPVSKCASFAVKFVVALVLGIVLGGVIPWILIRIGGARVEVFPLHAAVMIAAMITGVAFYASSMSRSVLQALTTAFCIPMLIMIIFGLCLKYMFEFSIMASQCYSTITVLVWPAITLTFLWLAFRNYNRLQIGWRVWVENLTRTSAVFGCVMLTSIAIFDRPWELFQSLEPRHGPARISGAGRANIGVSESGLCVLLPDGRLWAGERDRSAKSISGGFAPGSNWVEMAAGSEGAVAIRSDGTLWRIRSTSDMRQIGSDSDWKKIAGNDNWFQALKHDGTLWIATYVTHFIAAPVRVGNDSDWADIRAGIFVKRDGSKWVWEGSPIGAHGQRFLSARLVQFHRNVEGISWSSVAGWDLRLVIRTDGSLWVSGIHPSKIFGEKVRPGRHGEALRVGTKSDWVALSGGRPCVALEADGTFWTMEFDQSKRPSKYTDWLAATERYGDTWALAGDGTLSCWNEFAWQKFSTGMGEIILGPTRRPVLSCNILDKQQ